LLKNSSFVSGHRFSDAASSLNRDAPLGVCVRTGVFGNPVKESENAAPEGRTNLAQRFSAGKKWEE
jgi:hypothetical protein